MRCVTKGRYRTLEGENNWERNLAKKGTGGRLRVLGPMDLTYLLLGRKQRSSNNDFYMTVLQESEMCLTKMVRRAESPAAHCDAEAEPCFRATQ